MNSDGGRPAPPTCVSVPCRPPSPAELHDLANSKASKPCLPTSTPELHDLANSKASYTTALRQYQACSSAGVDWLLKACDDDTHFSRFLAEEVVRRISQIECVWQQQRLTRAEVGFIQVASSVGCVDGAAVSDSLPPKAKVGLIQVASRVGCVEGAAVSDSMPPKAKVAADPGAPFAAAAANGAGLVIPSPGSAEVSATADLGAPLAAAATIAAGLATPSPGSVEVAADHGAALAAATASAAGLATSSPGSTEGRGIEQRVLSTECAARSAPSKGRTCSDGSGSSSGKEGSHLALLHRLLHADRENYEDDEQDDAVPLLSVAVVETENEDTSLPPQLGKMPASALALAEAVPPPESLKLFPCGGPNGCGGGFCGGGRTAPYSAPYGAANGAAPDCFADKQYPGGAAAAAYSHGPAAAKGGKRGGRASQEETSLLERLTAPEAAGSSSTTTLILHRIPPQCTRARLLAEINFRGFGGSFDFLYLPQDFHLHVSRGYAVINFRRVEDARRFEAVVQRIPASVLQPNSQQPAPQAPQWQQQQQRQQQCLRLYTQVASRQGLAANVGPFRKRKGHAKDPLNLPLVFAVGSEEGVPLTRDILQEGTLEVVLAARASGGR